MAPSNRVRWTTGVLLASRLWVSYKSERINIPITCRGATRIRTCTQPSHQSRPRGSILGVPHSGCRFRYRTCNHGQGTHRHEGYDHDAPLVVPGWQLLEHALHRYLFHYFLRRARRVNDMDPCPWYDRVTRCPQCAYEWHLKHAQRTSRELSHDVRARAHLAQRVELDSRKLVLIPR